jgi:hypothetical protein
MSNSLFSSSSLSVEIRGYAAAIDRAHVTLRAYRALPLRGTRGALLRSAALLRQIGAWGTLSLLEETLYPADLAA